MSFVSIKNKIEYINNQLIFLKKEKYQLENIYFKTNNANRFSGFLYKILSFFLRKNQSKSNQLYSLFLKEKLLLEKRKELTQRIAKFKNGLNAFYNTKQGSSTINNKIKAVFSVSTKKEYFSKKQLKQQVVKEWKTSNYSSDYFYASNDELNIAANAVSGDVNDVVNFMFYGDQVILGDYFSVVEGIKLSAINKLNSGDVIQLGFILPCDKVDSGMSSHSRLQTNSNNNQKTVMFLIHGSPFQKCTTDVGLENKFNFAPGSFFKLKTKTENPNIFLLEIEEIKKEASESYYTLVV